MKTLSQLFLIVLKLLSDSTLYHPWPCRYYVLLAGYVMMKTYKQVIEIHPQLWFRNLDDCCVVRVIVDLCLVIDVKDIDFVSMTVLKSSGCVWCRFSSCESCDVSFSTSRKPLKPDRWLTSGALRLQKLSVTEFSEQMRTIMTDSDCSLDRCHLIMIVTLLYW